MPSFPRRRRPLQLRADIGVHKYKAFGIKMGLEGNTFSTQLLVFHLEGSISIDSISTNMTKTYL